MTDFKIAGDEYQTIQMPPKIQMRVLRRLARIAPALKGANGLTDQIKGGAKLNFEQMADLLAPVITAFADMSDDDVEFIIDTALDHARHRPTGDAGAGGRWFKVRDNGSVMNRLNSELNRSLVITYYVLQDNFSTVFNSFNPAAEASEA
jgi:hypothetical protein